MHESSQVMLVIKNPPANAGDVKDAKSIQVFISLYYH